MQVQTDSLISTNYTFLALNLNDLKKLSSFSSISRLMPAAPLREELFDLLLDACLKKLKPSQLSAIIEVTEEGYGFLLQEKDNYKLKAHSPFVPECLIKKFGLKTGHLVQGFIHPKIEEASCPILVQIDEIMGKDPEEASRLMPFTELVPYYPLETIFSETNLMWNGIMYQ